MRDAPELSSLSLDDLIQMRAMIMTLVEAGKTIALEGHGVTFDLTPGQSARITTPFQMPALPMQGHVRKPSPYELLKDLHRPLPVPVTPRPTFTGIDWAKQSDPTPPPAVPDADGAAVEPAPAVVSTAAGADAADVDGETVKVPDDIIAEIQSADEVAIEDDGGDPGPVLVEDSTKHPTGPRWTEAEDQQLVAAVAQSMADGLKMQRAAILAARDLSRPEQGTAYRCKTVLSTRIYDALAALKSGADKSKKASAELVLPPKAPVYDLEKVPSDLLPVATHLASVTPFGKWTPDRDWDLIRLAEELKWPMHEICPELAVTSQQAQQRLSTLTKGQAFKRAEVWAAMQAMGYGATGEAA